MSKLTAMLGLVTETPLHPGTGRVTGVVDLPVAREATTGYPTVPGSSLKGALRELARTEWDASDDHPDIRLVFGAADSGAGGVAVSDVRLLLLPVRSLTSHYRWVTCAYALERWQRDCGLSGVPVTLPEIPKVADGEALAATDAPVHLEELSFAVEAWSGLASVAQALAPLVAHEQLRNRLVDQLIIVSDNEFKYFAEYGLSVTARNALEKESKMSQNLWYEESLPPDTLLYALLLGRPGQERALERLRGLLPSERPYVRLGGNETVGHGWCAVAVLAGEEGAR